MQNQAIICEQESIYALGCGQLILKNPSFKGFLVIHTLAALAAYDTHETPSLLIIDSTLFDFKEPTTASIILKLKSTFPLMVLFNDAAEDLLLYQLVDLGVSVIVSRRVSSKEWDKAVEMAQLHKIYFCSTISERVLSLVNMFDKINLIEKVNKLSAYDKLILIRICEEASSKQIAAEVGHSKRTIEGHRTRLMQQLEVKNLAGLVKVTFVSKLYDHYLSNPGLYETTLCAKTSSL